MTLAIFKLSLYLYLVFMKASKHVK